MDTFKDKVALVTGGGSGIGLATVKRLRAEGATVVLADINPAAEAAAQEQGAHFVNLDVGNPDAWRDVIDTITVQQGGLDIAYLNAGIMTQPATEQGIRRINLNNLPDADYRRVMSVNVDGVVFGIQAVVPALQARGGGAIVATASIAGLMAYPTDAVYSGTKHFVIGMVRSMARILAKQQITINAVCPGGVATNIIGPPGVEDMFRERGFELMDPSVIADAVVHAITEGGSGRAWVCQPGRPHERYEFSRVPGVD